MERKIDSDTARKAMEALDLMFLEMDANNLADVIQVLAAVQHEIWSHWMRYMFTQGKQEHLYSKGETYEYDWIMPADKVERWKRQMNTPYFDLPTSEMKSDIDQAIKVVNALRDWYKKVQP